RGVDVVGVARVDGQIPHAALLTRFVAARQPQERVVRREHEVGPDRRPLHDIPPCELADDITNVLGSFCRTSWGTMRPSIDSPALESLREEVVHQLANHGLSLNAWQLFCLTTWRQATGRVVKIPLDAQEIFQDCVAVVLYSYHLETDSFTVNAEFPSQRAPTPPAPNVAPGSGVLAHVARTGRP